MKETRRLFGREKQLEELSERLRSERGLILVAGEAGVGKSRLIQEAVQRLGEHQSVVWARPEQVTRPGPYALVLDLVEDLIHRLGDVAIASSLRNIELRLQTSGIDAQSDLPLRRLGAEVRGAIAELGREPIVVLEDLHQADDASLAVVLMLVRTAVDDGYLILGSMREEEAADNPGLQRLLDVVARERLAYEMRLRPLNEIASRELATELLGPGVSGDLLRRILELGEGIPYYLEELAEAAHEGSGTLPKTVSRSAALRIQRLTAIARHVVQSAALLAGPVDEIILSEALEVDPAQVARALVEGLHIGLLSEREGKTIFRHALVRQALVDELSNIEKVLIHGQLARAIENVHSNELEAHAPSLAVHWYEARNLAKAHEYGLLAGRRGLSVAALAEARQAFELALASSPLDDPSPEALSGLAEVARREGDLEEAAELFRRASVGYLGRDLYDEAARAFSNAAWMTWLARRDPEVLGLLDDALDKTGAHSNSLRALLLTRKGKVLAGLGKLDDAETVLRVAQQTAKDSRDSATEAEVFEALATFLADFRSDMTAYHQYSQAACQQALSSGDAELIGRTHNNRALTLILREDIKSGMATLEIARQALERSFGASGLAILRITEAIARWRLGQPALVEQAISKSALSLGLFRGWVRILRAWANAHLGDFERAEQISRDGWHDIGLSPEDAGTRITSEAAAETALCSLVLSSAIGSSTGILFGRAVVRYYGDREEAVLAASLVARCAIAAGSDEVASELCSKAEKLLEIVPSPYLQAHIRETRGLVALATKDIDSAHELLEAAYEGFTSFGNLVDAARCMRLSAETTLIVSSVDEPHAAAVTKLRTARDLADQSGSALETARTEAKLRELGVRPRAGRPRKDRSAEETGSLSAREEQVAALVSAGLTNHEIAGRLYLSERTVQDHITHALRKLQLPGRAALAAWAVRNHRI